MACAGAVFFDMVSFEALAAAIKYSDYRNPCSLWWFARVSLDTSQEADALTCLNRINDIIKAKWLGESERSLSKWKKLATATILVIEQSRNKGKEKGIIEDLDRKIYRALKLKYGKSWSPIGGVFRKK